MSILEAHLGKGESIIAEAGALVYMKGEFEIKTKLRANILKTVKVSFLGSESFFVNGYTAKEDGCSIGLTGPQLEILWRFQLLQKMAISCNLARM